MSVKVKICGIKDAETMHSAIDYGAHFVGMVFYPPSPRHISITEAEQLTRLVPPTVLSIGLFVDPTDDLILNVLRDVPLGMIQLHGDEPPKRVSSIKGMTGLPIMKAIKLSRAEDLALAKVYEPIVDWLLFDAKSPDSTIPGGNACAFDWEILCDYHTSRPWMLAGGLTTDNLAEAIRVTKAKVVDVSSGVEDRPGLKNNDKIKQFVTLARGF